MVQCLEQTPQIFTAQSFHLKPHFSHQHLVREGCVGKSWMRKSNPLRWKNHFNFPSLLHCQPLRGVESSAGRFRGWWDSKPWSSWKEPGKVLENPRNKRSCGEQGAGCEAGENRGVTFNYPVLRSGMGFSPSLGGPAQIQGFWESMGWIREELSIGKNFWGIREELLN